MKKLIAFLIVSVMLFASCTSEGDDAEKTFIKEANALITELKYKEAYTLLYANRHDDEAKKMLGDFKVLHTKLDRIVYDVYNDRIETTFNEYGDPIHVDSHTYSEKTHYDWTFDYKYTYDENGNMLTSELYENGLENIDKKIEKTYNEKGQLIFQSETNYSYDNSQKLENTFTYCHKYEYDSFGNVCYYEYYYKVGESEEKNFVYYYRDTYDENGKKLKHEFVNTESNTYDREYTYDENGFLIKDTETKKNEITVIEYKVNERGDSTEKKTTSWHTDNDKEPYVFVETFAYEYDEKGRQTKIITTNANGTTETQEYAYNERGDIIRDTSIDYNGKIREEKTDFEYHENGKISKKTMLRNEFSTDFMMCEYNQRGDLIFEKTKKSERTSEYTYNEKGLVETTLKILDEKQKELTQFTYDENGNIIKKVCRDPDDSDGNDDVIYTYVFDDKNNCIKETKTYRNKDEVTETKYVYDEKGRYIEKTTFSEYGEYKNTYVYDDNGNEISSSAIDKNGNVTTRLDHTYDKNGNLIKTVQFKTEGKNDYPYTRTYTYNENGILTREYVENLDYSPVWDYQYSDFIYIYLPQK